ncbi:UNVERIFIED_CONTAM: Helicase protein MOM1 [Sesamum radiatum]|uniref:Helicase protein MOM1 n=1 Tax=Sesamum radiatum TaxID=300843 RepID=A0AAW2UNS7_SESRA
MTVTSFIESMNESARPFLIVTAAGSLSQWEAEFAQLVPSVDVVVYKGNKDTRKGIRASEFYEGGGQVMLQVLLSSAEAVLEDQTSEYLKILSLLESNGDFDKLRGSRFETNDNLCKLKDRLSRFVAYGSTSQVSKFLEYWVPVEISNYQLEQYCDTLLSNSIPLRSCSRNHPVRALHDILLTVRKCCDHPYLLDPSVQERLFAEQRPAAELLDIGIEASGKLKLLDTMLTEIKTRGLRLIIGSGGASTGDILDDFLRQRFGQHTYERIDAGVILSKKQAAIQLKDGEEPHVFWKNLLDGKTPQWKHLRGPCPRKSEESSLLGWIPRKPEIEKVDVVKKRKKLVNENLDPTLVKETQVAVSKGGASTIGTSNQSQIPPTCMSGGRSVGVEVSAGASDERMVSSDDQKSLQAFLQGEMTRLCQILKLSVVWELCLFIS